MSQLPAWQSLRQALKDMETRGVPAWKAKVKICKAIVTLRVCARLEVDDLRKGRKAAEIFEGNNLDIPSHLTPNDFDWAGSRPKRSWRVRREGSDEWGLRRADHIRLCGEDVRHWLCDEIDSVRLPKFADSPMPAPAARWNMLSRSEWAPSAEAASAIDQIAAASEILLDEAVSLMAFGTRSPSAGLGGQEIVAGEERAERALCEAAFEGKVRLKGSPTRDASDLHEVPLGYPFRRAGEPNSLGPDYEQVEPDSLEFLGWVPAADSSTSDDRHTREWFNVRVEPASFVEWMTGRIALERRRELRRRHSRRLFDHPFWSIETAVCWIALRDSSRLESDPEEADKLVRQVDWHGLDGDALVEYQPEIRLLLELVAGRLTALEFDVPLPKTHWAGSYPRSGGLGPETPQRRLDRAQVLARFPERKKSSRARDVEIRRAWIARYEARMSKTREWISIAEIADWYASRAVETVTMKKRRRNIIASMRASLAAGEFRANGKNRVVLRHPNTSVATFDHMPVDRSIDDGWQPETKVIDFFESCWLPNEVCRQWFMRKGLRWPEHFAVAKAKSPIDRGKAVSGPPNETSATVHARVEPTIAAVNDLEASVRGASTNVVARESERPPRKRTQRQRDRVKKVLEELYPGGVPDDVLPKELHDKVGLEFAQRKWSEVSIDTVSRAAGRREDLANRKSRNA